MKTEGAFCQYDPCDELAATTCTVFGEDPVILCIAHAEAYEAWLRKRGEIRPRSYVGIK